jgi:hypothetical protein
MCLIAPVSPMGRDDTRVQDKASDPHERERCQLPGIRIEPKFNSRINVIDGSVVSLVEDRWEKVQKLISFLTLSSPIREKFGKGGRPRSQTNAEC